jgi:hypothetical protein
VQARAGRPFTESELRAIVAEEVAKALRSEGVSGAGTMTVTADSPVPYNVRKIGKNLGLTDAELKR